MRPSSTPKADHAGRPLRPVGMPLTAEELERIDDVRFGKRFTSRVEAMRYLIHKGLEAETKQGASA